MSIAISSLVYANASRTLIDMDVSVDGAAAFPFTYYADDVAPMTAEITALLAGGNYSIGDYVAPAAPVPASVTRRQMLIGLTQNGFISSAEAIAAAATGTVPSAVQTVFDTLSTQAEKDAAAITWASMSVCERNNSLVAALAASQNLTDAEVDDLFRAWAAI